MAKNKYIITLTNTIDTDYLISAGSQKEAKQKFDLVKPHLSITGDGIAFINKDAIDEDPAISNVDVEADGVSNWDYEVTDVTLVSNVFADSPAS